MNETLQNLCKDVAKLKKKNRKLTIFAVIAGVYIISLTLQTKEQAAKIEELSAKKSEEGV